MLVLLTSTGAKSWTKSKMADTLQTSISLTKKQAQGHLSPVVYLKSATIAEEFPTQRKAVFRNTPKSRHRSKHPIINSRGHVTTATFYDWSRCHTSSFSSSTLQNNVLGTPGTPQNKYPILNTFLANTEEINTPTSFELSTQQTFTNPEIMFIRDKKILTKGEREIIEGIYKNRGDVTAADALGKSEFQVKCHKDAWYAGKSARRNMGVNKPFMNGMTIKGNILKPSCRMDIGNSSSSGVNGDRTIEDPLSRMPQNKSELFPPNNTNLVPAQNSSVVLPLIKCAICQGNAEGFYEAARKIVPKAQSFNYLDRSHVTASGKSAHSSIYDWIKQHALLDKLLGMRPPLHVGLNSQTVTIPVHCMNYELTNKHMKHKPDLCHNFQPKACFKCFPMLLNWVLEDLSVVSVQSASIASGRDRSAITKKHRPQREHVCEAVQPTKREPTNKTLCDACENYVETNDQHDEDRNESDLNKRLKVIVYVPTAELDHTENPMPVATSPEQRPRSQKSHSQTVKFPKKII